jgi:hypothetical protein
MTKYNYIGFNVYEAPKTRTKAGIFICRFDSLEDAQNYIEDVKKIMGFDFFIKGIKADGSEVTFI